MKRTLVPLLVLLPAVAAAQYKIVEPDGRITYTDRPPAASNARVTELRRNTAAAADNSGLAALPADLRQLAQRYPVVLYSTGECTPCDNGRQLLTQRGIPYSERKLVSEPEVQAAERALGWRTVPSLTIGTQALRGFSADEWMSFLDAAGYPKESRLPKNWQASPAPAPAAAPAAPRTPADVTTLPPSG